MYSKGLLSTYTVSRRGLTSSAFAVFDKVRGTAICICEGVRADGGHDVGSTLVVPAVVCPTFDSIDAVGSHPSAPVTDGLRSCSPCFQSFSRAWFSPSSDFNT